MNSVRTGVAVLLAAVSLAACSVEEHEPEQGSIRAQTEQIGHEAAQNIMEPIDKAELTVEKEEQRMREMEKRLDKME